VDIRPASVRSQCNYRLYNMIRIARQRCHLGKYTAVPGSVGIFTASDDDDDDDDDHDVAYFALSVCRTVHELNLCSIT